MKTLKSNLFVHVHGLQKVATMLCCSIIITLTTTTLYSQTMYIDNNFGSQGLTTIPHTTEHFYTNIDHNGNIITVGYSLPQAGEVGLEYISIAKTTSNGTIDADFGTNGLLRLTQYPNARVIDFKITEDNEILLYFCFGTNVFAQEIIIIRITQNGIIDSNFGNNGEIILNNVIANNTLAGAFNTEYNDYILIGKKSSPVNGQATQFSIVKYDNTGNIDQNFGINGEVNLEFNTSTSIVPQAIKILPDNSIIVAGYAIYNDDPDDPNYTHKELALCKLSASGQLVSAFANNGVWTQDVFQDFDLMHEMFRNIFVDNAGNILLSGSGYGTTTPYQGVAFLAKFNSNGIPDVDFGVNGFCPIDSLTFSLGIFQNGNDYILGSMNKIVSINPDGTITQTFNDNGYFSFNNYTFHTMVLQGQNKVIFGGKYNGNFTLMRAHVIAKSGEGLDPDPLSITNDISNSISVYPNPVKDNLNFTEETQVEITDIQGRILLKTAKAVKTFDVSSLQAGVYFLKTNNKVEKFVKQ